MSEVPERGRSRDDCDHAFRGSMFVKRNRITGSEITIRSVHTRNEYGLAWISIDKVVDY